MSKSLEMALRLFSPKGALHEPSSGNFNALGRDDLIGALQVAAKSNPQGLQYLMADHLVDQQAIAELLTYFSTTLGTSEAGTMALARVAGEVLIYLRRLCYVDTVAETRSCKREPGKRSSHRVFIKVIAIHPEPLPGSQSFRLNVLRSKLARLSKAMPPPRGAR